MDDFDRIVVEVPPLSVSGFWLGGPIFAKKRRPIAGKGHPTTWRYGTKYAKIFMRNNIRQDDVDAKLRFTDIAVTEF